MFLVLLAWGFQGLLLCGLGWPVYAWLFPPGRLSGVDLFRSFWVGFAVLLAVAQLYSLYAPLTGHFLAGASCAALPGLWWLGLALWRQHSDVVWTSQRLLFTGVLGLGVLAGAVFVSTPVWWGAYDTDLYHFSIVRWAKEYPTVPGLANLHNRLGMSSSYLLYAAVVDHGLLYGRAAWIVLGPFVLIFLAQWLWTILCDTAVVYPARIFCLLSLPYAVLLLLGLCPHLYYDRAAGIFLLVAVLELVRRPWNELERPGMPVRLFMLLVLSMTSFSIKPMGVVALALLLLFSGVVVWRRLWTTYCGYTILGVTLRSLLPALLLGGLLTRNAVLSGWLLYPAPYARLPVTWAMPASNTSVSAQSVWGQYDTIRAWARQPGPDFQQALAGRAWAWLPDWWRRNRHTVEMKLLAGGLLLLGLVLLPGRRRELGAALPYALLLAGASLVFWFLSAPDLRFGESFFWLWFALAGALLSTRQPSSRGTWIAAATLAVVMFGLARPVWDWPQTITWWHIGRATSANLHHVELKNGQQPPLRVWVPDSDDRAGDAPLPSTPYPQDNLCCRVPGNLRYGFYIAQPVAQP